MLLITLTSILLENMFPSKWARPMSWGQGVMRANKETIKMSHWVALYVNGNNVTYFDSVNVE